MRLNTVLVVFNLFLFSLSLSLPLSDSALLGLCLELSFDEYKVGSGQFCVETNVSLYFFLSNPVLYGHKQLENETILGFTLLDFSKKGSEYCFV